MILNNPQDLSPILAAMRAELKGDLDTLAQRVQNSNAELAQAVSTDTQNVIDGVNALSVVNGEINSEVKAINGHTTQEVVNARTLTSSELSKIPTSAIKNIYRGRTYYTSGETGQITIPSVNMSKTVVNLLSIVSTFGDYNGNPQERWGWLELISANKLQHHFDKTYSSTPHYISWEVIEYA
ncbi:hypothetical protein [Vibrio rotiferianus]|uniref:hypothetical protein n=1 Tax=Vibrio rotiferianus TaxID=190895 RepID=UPI0005EF6F06|nr:hypothetical protein [Vibrio rotiferianus]